MRTQRARMENVNKDVDNKIKLSAISAAIEARQFDQNCKSGFRHKIYRHRQRDDNLIQSRSNFRRLSRVSVALRARQSACRDK
jgi:hypothetical protein